MGSRLSFSRSEGTSVSPQRPHAASQHHSDSTSRPTDESRVHDRSHIPSSTQSEQQTLSRIPNPNRRGSDGLTDNVAASLATFNRLMSELEASGIAADDPRLLRLLSNYRVDHIDRGRSGSLSQHISSGHEGRRTNRHRRGRTVSSTDTGETGETAASRQTLMRQALLQLAAASSSTSVTSSRQRPWPEGLLLLDGRDRRCVFCKRVVPHDDYDLHYVMCLTRPRVTYNEDKLLVDKGECSICLEDLKAGDAIARLPCLCIYHKACIDSWFQRKQTCPEHPGD